MNPPKTAMVLAAGLGTRMRPLTNERPKPLIEVGGKTLLDHALDQLGDAGVSRAVVNAHYLADQIEHHVARRTRAPHITLSDERAQLLETGGALVKARALLGDDPIIVTNTDQVFEPATGAPIRAMARHWDGLAMDALLLLAPHAFVEGFDGAGDFFLAADGRIGRRGRADSAPYVYTGVQILNPRLLDGLPEEPFSLNRVWDVCLENARLFGCVLDGRWIHVGDPAGLEAAERRFAPAL